MPDLLHMIASLLTVAFAGLGGVFLAFSDFLMRSFDKAGQGKAVPVMQSVNREVFRHVFIPAFLIAAATSLVLPVYLVMRETGSAVTWLSFASVTYLAGCFGVTVLRNVPMNNRLEALEGHEAETYWRDVYRPRWTFWNSVRTAACFVAAGLCQAALLFA